MAGRARALVFIVIFLLVLAVIASAVTSFGRSREEPAPSL